MDEKSHEAEDSSNATPRTSNKRTVSLEAPPATGSVNNTSPSTGLPSIQEAVLLPLRNPLHNSDSEGSLFEAHFQANEGAGDLDSRPVVPRRKSSASSFQSDSDKTRSLEQEMNLQDEGEDGGMSVSSSYVGDVDERVDDGVQFQGKPSSVVSESAHTEATGMMSASGVTHTSTTSPERAVVEKESDFSAMEGPNAPKSEGSFVGDPADNPLSESNIPGESFMKMGSLMQSHLVEGGNQITGMEESGEKDDHDTMLDDILDDTLIAAGEEEVANAAAEPEPPKDQHDDLLDSVLDAGDGGIHHMAVGHQDHLIDHDDALLDSMLGDDDEVDHVAAANLPSSEQPNEYVPDESIRKLEALLDEGLAGHDPLADEI